MVAGVLLLTRSRFILLFRLRNLLFMVFVAAFIAVAIEPAVHFLEKRGWRRGLATGLVFLVAFLLGVAFLALLVPLFINQVNDLIDALPGYIETVSLRLNEWFGLEISTESLQEEAAGFPTSSSAPAGPSSGSGQRHHRDLQLPLLRHHRGPLCLLHGGGVARAAEDGPVR